MTLTKMSNIAETVLEIDLQALSHNYHYLKSKLQPNTKFLAVVKAFAYGSDSEIIAYKLQNLGVDYFAVAYTQEGITLREAGITKPILVLHPQAINFQNLIKHCLEPSIYSISILKQFVNTCKAEEQRNYPIHIKFNTGLNRLGILEKDVLEITSILNSTKAVRTESLFSHLAASEDKNEAEFTKQQISSFNRVAAKFKKASKDKPWLHLSNTSGVLNYPEAHFNMVRCGIGLYGFGNCAKEDSNLIPIANLKSIISQIHSLTNNDTVGYNRTYKVVGTEKTATIPIGHADGISRQLGNQNGYVYINNKKAPIIGNVCMDMIMVNVTDIDCKEEDEVIIFNNKHKANTLAASTNTITYEILTAISQRVKRKIID